MHKQIVIFLLHLFIFVDFLTAQNLNRQSFPELERKISRRMILLPDIEGFITLKGDFHMHTVFSDGTVWAENRIEEAYHDGLDAIAITDHYEYRPHKEYVKEDYNAAYNIASGYTADKNIILIHGVEITKKMPPGHFNALFVQDAAVPELADTSLQAFLTAIEKLHNQGAFIFWNHPGWSAQQKDTVKWFDVHQLLLEKGWLSGIEIFNYIEWYPVALEWALTKNLAPFANSDVHDPMASTYSTDDGFIRPMTLIFATERSEKGIREAMTARRTVAFFNGHLAGSEDLLGKLFDKSLKIHSFRNTKGKTICEITNDTDFTLVLKGLSETWKGELTLAPRSVGRITVNEEVKSLHVEVTNWHTGMRKNLEQELRF
jgi:predicted metal-dependent phosphoesterase TrpH